MAKNIHSKHFRSAVFQALNASAECGNSTLQQKTISLQRFRDATLLSLNHYLGLSSNELSALNWLHLIDGRTRKLKITGEIPLPSGKRYLFISNTDLRSVLETFWIFLNQENCFDLQSPVLISLRSNGRLSKESVKNRIAKLYLNEGCAEKNKIDQVSSLSGHKSLRDWLQQQNVGLRIQGIILNNKKLMRSKTKSETTENEINMAMEIMASYEGMSA